MFSLSGFARLPYQGKPASTAKQHLSAPLWIAAYMQLATAAAATRHWSLGDSLSHLQQALRIADKYSLGVAQCYDDLCRQEWAHQCAQQIPSFSVPEECKKRNQDALDIAIRRYVCTSCHLLHQPFHFTGVALPFVAHLTPQPPALVTISQPNLVAPFVNATATLLTSVGTSSLRSNPMLLIRVGLRRSSSSSTKLEVVASLSSVCPVDVQLHHFPATHPTVSPLNAQRPHAAATVHQLSVPHPLADG